MKTNTDFRARKEDQNYAKDAKETNFIFLFSFRVLRETFASFASGSPHSEQPDQRLERDASWYWRLRMKTNTDFRTRKEDQNYAKDAKETNFIFCFPFASFAKPSRPLRPEVRIRKSAFGAA